MLILPDGREAPPPLRPFVILALPRSRTAWLAHWLHAPEHPVGHDIAIECSNAEVFVRSFGFGMRGTVETAAVEGWRRIAAEVPGVRFVTVRRPLREVQESLAKFGLDATGELEKRDADLDEVEAVGLAERIDFADLVQRGCRKWLWRYLLPEVAFDPARDAEYAGVNIQVDMPARIAQLRRRAEWAQALRKDLADAAS